MHSSPTRLHRELSHVSPVADGHDSLAVDLFWKFQSGLGLSEHQSDDAILTTTSNHGWEGCRKPHVG
ncbi:hypothetical protein CDEST_00403 [Colletotrichum destructivum]|uniref:Uncharacterized protein n=1 Tax=Colletotrichum destructivum TaxID=34406 RepID=A0AAX4HWX2_9PEZI|nr:hypothetical protein CDEST_00403 [Colletotrichum destructivum]